MDAIEFSTDRLTSPFSMHQFMNDINRWDMTVKKIQALKPVGVYTLQVAGRFDIAADDLYDDPLLDWVLIVYNGFKHIGDFGTLQVNETIPIVLPPGGSVTADAFLQHSTLKLKVGNTMLYAGNGLYLVAGKSEANIKGMPYSPFNDVRITYSDVSAFIENIDHVSTLTEFFTLVYPVRSADNSLDTGTAVVYPSKIDIKNALKIVTEEKNKTIEGFARL